MTVTVDEMKNYLRIDYEDDDSLIENFITAGKKQCMDILRTDDEADLDECANGKIAVMSRWLICMSTGKKPIITQWI